MSFVFSDLVPFVSAQGRRPIHDDRDWGWFGVRHAHKKSLAIRRWRVYAGSHLAAGLVAERASDQRAVGAAFVQAAKLWGGADPHLPELALIRSRK